MATGIVTVMLPMNVMAPVLLAGMVALAGCGSTPQAEPGAKSAWLPDVQGAPIELGTSQEMLEIAQLEFERSTGAGRLLEYLRHADPALRRRAALALGRLPYLPRESSQGSPEEPSRDDAVTAALCRALEDADAAVRLTAAFALGLRADPQSLGVLEAYRHDADPRLRARVVEAASWIADPQMHQELLLALRDSNLQVRIEAAVATARWDPDAAHADDVDRALLDTLRPYAIAPSGTNQRTNRTAVEAELVWRILFALSRRGAELGRGAFLEYAGSDVPLDRLFALRGLARIEGDAQGVEAASRALLAGEAAAHDWRVAYEATRALGHMADPQGVPALAAAAEHKSVHVRAGAMQALGQLEKSAATLKLLNRGLVDLSPNVRSAALASLVTILPADDAIERLEAFARHDEIPIRVGAANAASDAAGGLDDPRVAAVLRDLARDPNLLVATRAIEGLGRHMDPETRELLHRALGNSDNGLRLAAVLALRQAPDPQDVELLILAFEASEGDVSSEVDFNVLQTLGQIGGEEARRFVSRAASDARPYVRRVARRVLAEDFGVEPEPSPGTDTAAATNPGPVPFPGRDFPDWKFNPLVEIATSKGELVFELFPAEAPVHVHNFLELARRGEYDGIEFHRVVPDFVLQGGDYRGDGNGARPWRGESLPHEFGPRKYTTGSLGMPRNQDVDSGGSQFFVTHRPTPHLDGRYTIFGELRAGGEVLDRLEACDRILGVRVLR